MKKIWAREEPVVHEGREISLPYTGEGAMGVGKPLKSILHMNPNIPVYLGTGMESMVRLPRSGLRTAASTFWRCNTRVKSFAV